MSTGGDLTAEALAPFLGDRLLRTYPALVSNASAAFDWAGSGAPDGAVIVSDYQLSPRGHAGRPWKMEPGRGLGFSVVMRPSLPEEREGWLYTVATGALADVCGEGAAIEWPDQVHLAGRMSAAVAIRTWIRELGLEWAVVDFLLPDVGPPRGELLAAILAAIDARRAQPPDALIDDYERRCGTLGRQVRVQFIAGTGPKVEGRAVATLEDGALLLELGGGSRAPVRPQDVRGVEDA